jgi:hypothetical protein
MNTNTNDLMQKENIDNNTQDCNVILSFNDEIIKSQYIHNFFTKNTNNTNNNTNSDFIHKKIVSSFYCKFTE